MREKVFIEYDVAEGAVIRMIGLIERRGFRVSRIAMAEQPCGRRGTLALEIVAHDPGRDIETMALQLGRLPEVSRVSHEAAVAPGALFQATRQEQAA
ncbi:MAG TPA: ACT domain-containing protein [Allosphingosinicella sp.]